MKWIAATVAGLLIAAASGWVLVASVGGARDTVVEFDRERLTALADAPRPPRPPEFDLEYVRTDPLPAVDYWEERVPIVDGEFDDVAGAKVWDAAHRIASRFGIAPRNGILRCSCCPLPRVVWFPPDRPWREAIGPTVEISESRARYIDEWETDAGDSPAGLMLADHRLALVRARVVSWESIRVLAHEYWHQLFADAVFGGMPARIEEGFCDQFALVVVGSLVGIDELRRIPIPIDMRFVRFLESSSHLFEFADELVATCSDRAQLRISDHLPRRRSRLTAMIAFSAPDPADEYDLQAVADYFREGGVAHTRCGAAHEVSARLRSRVSSSYDAWMMRHSGLPWFDGDGDCVVYGDRIVALAPSRSSDPGAARELEMFVSGWTLRLIDARGAQVKEGGRGALLSERAGIVWTNSSGWGGNPDLGYCVFRRVGRVSNK